MSDGVAAPPATRTAVLLTHRAPAEVEAVGAAAEAAGAAGWRLVCAPDEAEKLGVIDGLTVMDALPDDPGLCLVLGGDGTILRGLQRYAGTSVPVFAVNFGRIGFLAAVEREELAPGLRRAFAGEFEVLEMPGLEVAGRPAPALNDVTFSRRPADAMAELAYSVAGQEIGHVRCDGLVAATPAGSTGYNLANGGPVLAWGVEGFAVSFIAPHTLTARALVVAPGDVLHVRNVGNRDSVAVALDGRHEMDLGVGEEVEVRFRDGVSRLAQIPGSTFYARMRLKFGQLAG